LGHLSAATQIEVSPSRVFSFVSDPANAPRYISSIRRVWGGPEEGLAAGQRWHAEAVFMGKPARIILRLDSLRHDEAVAFSLQGDLPAVLEIRLRGLNGGKSTGVSMRLSAPSVPGLLLQAIMGGLLNADLARLKALLERTA
jgi:uncharacterized protein YndB with AHSA1/START domain